VQLPNGQSHEVTIDARGRTQLPVTLRARGFAAFEFR